MTIAAYVRRGIAFAALALATACVDADVTSDPVADLGNFRLGHNVVVSEGMQQGPFSRKATEEEVQTAVTKAMAARFGRYQGEKLYHIGLKVEAYALAMPGVPVVFTPKSVLVISANVWDDAANKKLNEKPELFTVFEGLSGSTVLGSGLTRRKDEQLALLSANVAKRVERWLLENGEWFDIDPSKIPEPLDDDPLKALAAKQAATQETPAPAN